jgi:hypothetical protein
MIDRTKRAETIAEAHELIHGDRQRDYGVPSINFDRIATRWSQTLGHQVTAYQVAIMMADLKMARVTNGRYHHDSIVDAIGYLALASELKVGVDE